MTLTQQPSVSSSGTENGQIAGGALAHKPSNSTASKDIVQSVIEERAGLEVNPASGNSDENDDPMRRPFSHFSKFQKTLIIVLTAYCGILGPFSSSSYFPAIQTMAEDLDVSLSMVNSTVSVFLYAMAVFPLFWTNAAERYGRRYMYISSMLVYMGGCVGCALSTNIAAMLASRIIQSMGSSSVLGVGAGTIADVFEREQRGTAMGFYFMGALLGPPLAPIIGGAVAQHLGWRAIFWMLTIMAGIACIGVTLLLPETHRRIVAQRHKIQPVNIPPKPKWRDNNPVNTLLLARNPVILAIIFHNSMIFGCYILVSNSNTFVMQSVYRLSETTTGITYLGMGMGCLLGSVVGGRLVDFLLSRERKKLTKKTLEEGGDPSAVVRVPAEIRIRYLWTGAVVFIACSIGYGWMAQHGNVPLAGVIVVQFLIGFSMTWQLSNTSNYLVDLYATRSASITASQSFFRSIWSGICTQIIITIKDGVGWGWEFTIFGGLAAISGAITLLISFNGEQIRRRFPIDPSK